MLFQKLDEVCARIDRMDIAVEAPRFAAQLRKMRPGLEGELKAQGIPANEVKHSIQVLSGGQLGVIKGIPTIVNEMSEMLRSGSWEPAYRCVLAASLAYLVQPNDLLPDDLPGGYGFVDDALLLHEACALSWELAGNMARAEQTRKIFQFIFIFVPDGSGELFQTAISSLAMTLNVMRLLDPVQAEMTAQMLIANPLQPIAPPTGTGAMGAPSAFGSQFTNYPGYQETQYTWQDGNTIGVNFPGGGGVVSDGTNIIPL